MSRACAALVVSLLLAAGSPTAVSAEGADVSGAAGWAEARLPGGAEAVARAAGLTAPVDRSLLMVELVRRLHGNPSLTESVAAATRRRVAEALRGGGEPDAIPMRLPGTFWSRAVFDGRVPPDDVAAALLADRRAALFYHGVAALDPGTASWLASDPGRATRLFQRHAELVGAFGRSLHVEAGRVRPPGGEAAADLWQRVVGAPLTAPESFFDQLFARDAGRQAWLYDVVAHLPAPVQAHVLGATLPSLDARVARLRALADVFARVAPTWRIAERPLWRPLSDPALWLGELRVRADGTLDGPFSAPVADAAFAGDAGEPRLAAAVAAEPLDAAALAGRVFLADPARARDRAALALFAQRVFPSPPPSTINDVVAVCRAFGRAPALALSLERIGVATPAVFAAIVRQADEVTRRGAPEPLAALQGALALVERMRLSRALARDAAETLLGALAATPIEPRGAEPLARWVRDRLLPAVGDASTARSESPLEAQVLDALAGRTTRRGAGERRSGGAEGGAEERAIADAARRRVEWEGQRYLVDVRAAERARLDAVRAAQGGPSLDSALAAALGAEAATSRDPGAVRLVAETLAALVYAASLPAHEGIEAAGRLHLRHDFGTADRAPDARLRTPWRLADSVSGGGAPWRLRGSLLALDLALAPQRLRRVSDEPPIPTLHGADRDAMVATVPLVNPFDLTDASRDAIVAAIARGADRLANLDREPARADAAVRAAAVEAGLSEWRVEALAWRVAHDRAELPRAFSLAELLWLGQPDVASIPAIDAWGVSLTSLTGQLAARAPRARAWEELAGHWGGGVLAGQMADLNLRTAQQLAAFSLPAELARDLLAVAVRDLLDRAAVSSPDDQPSLVAFVRDLSNARFEDYVAALTVEGPLRPTPDEEPQP